MHSKVTQVFTVDSIASTSMLHTNITQPLHMHTWMLGAQKCCRWNVGLVRVCVRVCVLFKCKIKCTTERKRIKEKKIQIMKEESQCLSFFPIGGPGPKVSQNTPCPDTPPVIFGPPQLTDLQNNIFTHSTVEKPANPRRLRHRPLYLPGRQNNCKLDIPLSIYKMIHPPPPAFPLFLP